MNTVEKVLGRILTFPAPTVAAVNGHAFGAGAFAILAHDHAVMRADRGFVCWPEVHLQMTFSPGLMAMIRNIMTNATAREAVTTGRRYGGLDAFAAGFVNEAVSLDRLMIAASEYGRAHSATAGANLQKIKRQLHRPVVDPSRYRLSSTQTQSTPRFIPVNSGRFWGLSARVELRLSARVRPSQPLLSPVRFLGYGSRGSAQSALSARVQLGFGPASPCSARFGSWVMAVAVRRCRLGFGRVQFLGTSAQGIFLSTRGSPGSPSICSPMMLRSISDVPPSIELARALKKR